MGVSWWAAQWISGNVGFPLGPQSQACISWASWGHLFWGDCQGSSVLPLTDLHASIKLAEGFVHQSAGLLHHTGIPEGISCKRSDTQMARGASLYICPHPSCCATPYIGNLPGCGSHLCRVHYGTCLLCPFCPNKRYYCMSGWKDHMNSKHHHVPWYGARTSGQADSCSIDHPWCSHFGCDWSRSNL